ncbi:MAG: DUF167 domain-containing protein [Parcubacteria group bacterium]|nr:DUF167 domain-containing protein [Parcubacteria group bacterium]
MKIVVTAKPNASKDKVDKIDETLYVVSTRAYPRDGKANKAIIELLAEYFHVAKSCITITSGHTSHRKVIEVIGL